MLGNYELQRVSTENILNFHGLRYQWLQEKNAFLNSIAVCFHNKPYLAGNMQSFVSKI